MQQTDIILNTVKNKFIKKEYVNWIKYCKTLSKRFKYHKKIVLNTCKQWVAWDNGWLSRQYVYSVLACTHVHWGNKQVCLYWCAAFLKSTGFPRKICNMEHGAEAGNGMLTRHLGRAQWNNQQLIFVCACVCMCVAKTLLRCVPTSSTTKKRFTCNW